MKTSFLSEYELKQIGFKSIGKDVLISSRASFYDAANISIGDNVRIDDFCILSGKITIGSFIHIAAYSGLFGGNEGIVIEDFSNISSRVCIYAVNDDYSGETLTNPMVPNEYKNVYTAPVLIKRHVIIGSNSLILPGVIIGEGCAFGAYSYINRSTESWKIYFGIPAKLYKERKKDLLNLELKFLKAQDRMEANV